MQPRRSTIVTSGDDAAVPYRNVDSACLSGPFHDYSTFVNGGTVHFPSNASSLGQYNRIVITNRP